MRAFIAVDISDEIRKKIEDVQHEFRFLKSARFVDAKQAHITLKFLGEISAADEIIHELSSISVNPFKITFKGVGFFPEIPLDRLKERRGRVRVVWIGVDDSNGKALQALQQDVDARMAKLGFAPEKDFSPHTTICRIKRSMSRDEIESFIKRIKSFENTSIGTMIVDSIKLKKSTLTQKGPIYDDIYVHKLS